MTDSIHSMYAEIKYIQERIFTPPKILDALFLAQPADQQCVILLSNDISVQSLYHHPLFLCSVNHTVTGFIQLYILTYLRIIMGIFRQILVQ